MKTFADRLREDRRLVILRLLSEQPGYRFNSSNLHAGLQYLGVLGTRTDVTTDIHWLKEQGLLLIQDIPEVDGLYLCTLTQRGADVAEGNSTVPGVSRPSPK